VKAARHSVPEGNAMFIRVYRARLKAGMRSAYERLCCEVSLPTIRAQPGCLATQIGTPRAGQPEDFVVVSLWSDVESLRAFAGEQWQQAIIVPGEADLLEQVRVEHYDETYRSLVQLWRAQAGMVKRREVTAMAAPLSDAQWQAVRRVLPAQQGRGRPRADDRRTLDGILYVLRNGCRWQDIPTAYGDPVTCWRRFVRWESDGTWEHIWRTLLAVMDPAARLAWALAFMDSKHIPTKQRRTLGKRLSAAVAP
jgi:transposase/quinol monooxygenase YgiN